MRSYRLISFLIILIISCLKLNAAEFKIQKIGSNLSHPWGISQFSDNEVLVTERKGIIHKVNINTGVTQIIKNIPKVFSQRQGGLLDLLIDEDIDGRKRVYICYSASGSSGYSTRLSMGSIKDNSFILKKTLFSSNNARKSAVHFGCRIAIKDKDVFLSIGDRGYRDDAQNPKSHAGSIIKINKITGRPPNDNTTDRGWLAEIYTKGHRNPQGMAINPSSRDIWVNEHGPKGGDEINILRKGKNYGWPIVSHGREYSGGKIGKGIKSLKGFEDPVWYWVPSIAPSGMSFYDKNMFPEFKGHLLVSSLKFKSLYLVKIKNGLPESELALFRNKFGRIRDVEVLTDGSLLILNDMDNGGIYRIFR